MVLANGWAWHLTRNAITIAHEGGHALASLLTGRRLYGIRLHSDTSGETRSRGKPHGPGMVFTTMAQGHLTPPLLGAGAAALLAAHHVVLLLWLLLVLLAATLLAIRNAYGALAVLVTAAAVVAVTLLLAPVTVQVCAVGYAAAWFLLLGGVRPVVELQRSRGRARRYHRTAAPGRVMWQGRGPQSDADQLAGLTGRARRRLGSALFLLAAFARAASLHSGRGCWSPVRCTCRGSGNRR